MLSVLFTCVSNFWISKWVHKFTYNDRKTTMSFKYSSVHHTHDCLNKVLVSKNYEHNLIYSVITKLSDHVNARETMPDKTN